MFTDSVLRPAGSGPLTVLITAHSLMLLGERGQKSCVGHVWFSRRSVPYIYRAIAYRLDEVAKI
jgi:hypothetical protein